MKTIKQTYHIKAPVEKVWKALVEPELIGKWGAGPAKMDDKVGTKFSLWGGDIYGTNVEVVKEKKLVQEWFGGKWDAPSILTFTLNSKGDTTEVHLMQENIPDSEFEDIEQGWKDYYMGPLKEFVEINYLIFFI